MASGQFLQNLSSGIFDRLGQLREEQTQRDDQQKAQVIQLLAGLADKVEPESLPTLMGHIWDTIGVKKQAKGKGLRGFLDAFSGMPNRSIEDQLGTKLREVTQGGMVGPEEAKVLRGLNKERLLKPYRAEGTRPRSMEALNPDMAPELQGKMVFRDPYQQKLDEIEARYKLQYEGALQKQMLLQEQQQKDRLEIERVKNLNRINMVFNQQLTKAQQPEYRTAYQLWYQDVQEAAAQGKDVSYIDPTVPPPTEYMARAASIALAERDAKLNNLGAGTEQKRASAEYLRSKANGGGAGGTGSTSARRFDAAQFKVAQDEFTKRTTAEATEKRLRDQINSAVEFFKTTGPSYAPIPAIKKLADEGKIWFDVQQGAYRGSSDVAPMWIAIINDRTTKERADFRKDWAEFINAKATLRSTTDTLRSMPDYADVQADEQGFGTVKLKGAVAPAVPELRQGVTPARPAATPPPPAQRSRVVGEQPTSPAMAPTNNAGGNTVKIPTDKSDEVKAWTTGQTVKPAYLKGNWIVGETINENGREFKVLRRAQ